MKRFLILIFIFSFIFILACLTCCNSDKTLISWFNDIEPEASIEVVGVDGNRLYSNDSEYMFDLRQYCVNNGLEYRFLEALVVHKEKVYFITKNEQKNQDGTLNLQICSVDLNGENFKSVEIGAFGVKYAELEAETNKYSQAWYRFAGNNYPRSDENIMAEYNDGYIYVRDICKTVKFNVTNFDYEISDESFSEVFFVPFNIECKIENNSVNLLISNKITGETRTITTDDILNNMACGEKFRQLEKFQDYDGHSYLDGFCYNTWRCIDDAIYFNFTVYNYYGDSIPVTLKYDYEKNEFYFLFAGHKGDSLELRVFVIPWLSEDRDPV